MNLQIQNNFDLRNHNTFGINSITKYFVEINEEQHFFELHKLLNKEFKDIKIFVLGRGSNVLLSDKFDGLIIHPAITGIDVETEFDSELVTAQCGEEWDSLVNFSVERGLWGIENLSLIPGNVGAVPVQNVGAYGVEIKDVLSSIKYFDLIENKYNIITNSECKFGYRDSIFKHELKNRAIISSITLKLDKTPNPKLDYSNLKSLLPLACKDIKLIRETIIKTRNQKLPDVKILGNVGSFFKNPIINEEHFDSIKEHYSEIPFYETGKNYKIPAAWLIEKCGWKGKRIGNVGVYEKQALILVNYGGATCSEILAFSQQIIDSVFEKFKIKLDEEVNKV